MKNNGPKTPPNPVVLYDHKGNPVHVNPEHIQSPRQQPTVPTFEKAVQTDSHVTAAPQALNGHNFDPQLRAQYANEPGVIHATRPIEPQQMQISEEMQRLHDESVKKYPDVNLSEGEYVIHDVYRHPIGLLGTVGVSAFIILVVLAIIFSYPFVIADDTDFPISFGLVTLIGSGLIILMAIFGYIGAWVYLRNRLILTNESVIQEIQHSLFSKHEQTVSLGSIEDASYQQRGIIPTAFNYGLIRLSTEGEETTYRFNYAHHPKEQTAILINAVEAFKNGRPVTKEILNKVVNKA